MRPQIFPLSPNRVYRSYPGGRVLDEMAGAPDPQDGHFPEDWIASTTRAINAGRDEPKAGISKLLVDGQKHRLDELVAAQPAYFLSDAYRARFGDRIAPLVKFLDSAVRLQLQCHPTVPFAQQHFGSNWGKTEAYHILAIRPDNPAPFIFLGFQNPPPREEMKRMVLEQDIPALENCFKPVPVAVGQTYLVPGGLPHAIGPGILMVEVMEPTDFVSRFEWNCAGNALPEESKFMGRDVEFGLDMLDFRAFSIAAIREKFQPSPLPLDGRRTLLLGEPHTRSFRIEQWEIQGELQATLDSFAVGIVLEGTCEIEDVRYERYGRFFVPFAAREFTLTARDARVLMIFPPAA